MINRRRRVPRRIINQQVQGAVVLCQGAAQFLYLLGVLYIRLKSHARIRSLITHKLRHGFGVFAGTPIVKHYIEPPAMQMQRNLFTNASSSACYKRYFSVAI